MPAICEAVLEMEESACRYTKLADWEYINQCASSAKGLQLIGNGDIMSYTDYNEHMRACPDLATTMLARGALIKPWLFTEVRSGASLVYSRQRPKSALCSFACDLTSSDQPSTHRPQGEQCPSDACCACGNCAILSASKCADSTCSYVQIKEQRHWDITAVERLDIFKDFCSAGLLHWGSDSRGVETTRRFMLEWMSFTHRCDLQVSTPMHAATGEVTLALHCSNGCPSHSLSSHV